LIFWYQVIYLLIHYDELLGHQVQIVCNHFLMYYNSLLAAFKRGRIQGFTATQNIADKNFSGAINYKFTIPRYYAIFFNQEKNPALADLAVRQALNYAINKQEIIEKALNNHALAVDSPFLSAVYGLDSPSTIYNYDPQKAAQILDDNGYLKNNDGLRIKNIRRQPAFQFTKNLAAGSKLSNDIKELQKCLIKEIAPDLEVSGNFGSQTTAAVKLFQEKYRAEILDPQGLAEATGDVKAATRDKLNQVCFPSGDQTVPLTFSLTIANQEPFITVAQIIKNQLAAIGVTVNINNQDVSALEYDITKPRNYEALLYGQALGIILDPYPFWHSTQKDDPGLNFARYQNENIDKLLSEIRQTVDSTNRQTKLNNLQNLILNDAPAIFLYNPDYIYTVSKNVKNVSSGIIANPSQRFCFCSKLVCIHQKNLEIIPTKKF